MLVKGRGNVREHVATMRPGTELGRTRHYMFVARVNSTIEHVTSLCDEVSISAVCELEADATALTQHNNTSILSLVMIHSQ